MEAPLCLLRDRLLEQLECVTKDAVGLNVVCAHAERTLDLFRAAATSESKAQHGVVLPSTPTRVDMATAGDPHSNEHCIVHAEDLELENLLAKARCAMPLEGSLSRVTRGRDSKISEIRPTIEGTPARPPLPHHASESGKICASSCSSSGNSSRLRSSSQQGLASNKTRSCSVDSNGRPAASSRSVRSESHEASRGVRSTLSQIAGPKSSASTQSAHYTNTSENSISHAGCATPHMHAGSGGISTRHQSEHFHGKTLTQGAASPNRRPGDLDSCRVPFDREKWLKWRNAQRTFLAQESRLALDKNNERAFASAAEVAATKARLGWRQSLNERHHARQSNAKGATSRMFTQAYAAAGLCSFAIEKIIPSPSLFLDELGLLSSREASDSNPSDLEKLFPLMALIAWLSRLASEAGELVPGILQAREVLKDASRNTTTHQQSKLEGVSGLTSKSISASLPPHPLALLEHLPSEAATRAVLVAARRNIHLEQEAHFAKFCQEHILCKVDHKLQSIASGYTNDTVGEAPEQDADIVVALQALRLVSHICSEKKALLSFWRAPICNADDRKAQE